MKEIQLAGKYIKVYTPLYGTIAYLIEEIERMLDTEEELLKRPHASAKYTQGWRDGLKDVLKLAKQLAT